MNSGQYEEAETTATAALDIIERTAEGSFLVGVARCLIARSLEGQGHPAADTTMSEAHTLLVGSRVSDTYREFCRVPENQAINND